MKQFTVTWHADVEDAFANLVVAHWGTPQLEQISRASAHIDRLLSERPLEVGTTAGANLRVITVPPLTVHYAVFAEDRIVSLLQYRFLNEE